MHRRSSVGMGQLQTLEPMYGVEVTPPSMRGSLVALFAVGQCVGQLAVCRSLSRLLLVLKQLVLEDTYPMPDPECAGVWCCSFRFPEWLLLWNREEGAQSPLIVTTTKLRLY